MKKLVNVAALAAAFGTGIVAAPLFGGAVHAAPGPVKAQYLDLAAMGASDLPTPEPGPNSHLRTTEVVDQPGAGVRIQIGTVPKHYHKFANEIQYVISGRGTEWFGNERVTLRPGIMLVIPKGMTHGGTVETEPLKIIAIKTPPQLPDDNHRLP